MTLINRMKSESLEEARERLAEQSQMERDGFEAASEGQLVADRTNIDGEPEEGDARSEVLAVNDALRVLPSVQDKSDEDAVNWTRSTRENGPDVQIHGEGAKKASRSAAKSRRAAKRSDGE